MGAESEHVERAAGQALADALDRISDGIIVYDCEWRITYLNQSAEEHFGRSRDDLVGRTLREAFPAVAGSELEQELLCAADGTLPHEFLSFTPVRRRWVAFRAYPSDTGLTVYFRDVTLRKAAEDALKDSEARHRALFEHSPSALLLTTPVGDVLAANPAACRMFEMAEEELCAVGHAALVDGSDPRSALFLEACRREGRAQAEITCFRKGGRSFPAAVSSVIFRDATGAERSSMHILDLGSRKRAEEAVSLLADAGKLLVESLDADTMPRDLARLIVPRFADGCVVDVVREDGSVQRTALGAGSELPVRRAVERVPWTRAFERVFATRRAERIAEPSAGWLREAALEPVDLGCPVAEACPLLVLPYVARNRSIGVMVLFRHAGRDPFDDADVRLAEGLADRAAAAFDNATLYAAALEARRLRDEVLGVVSHDLRSPLNGIALTARLIARRHPGDPGPRIILDATALANQLIGDLLLAAKLDSGMFVVDAQLELVGEIVDEVIELARPEAEERSIELRSAVDSDVTEAFVDRVRLLQLLGNLVANALKFTPPGGSVGVHARRSGEWVELAVSDTGAGIPPEQLPHLFDRFWQGAHSHSSDAGLGLSIAKGIAEAHGGTIRVETEPGRGSTFRVTLPVEGRGAARPAVAS